MSQTWAAGAWDAADAEDVLQETWLRWADIDRSQVHEPRAYLVRAVTRQALNRLRTLSRRREEYVGEWLPEPLLTHPDVADDVELAESVSIAMLAVLETLRPTERAVFVLREVFGVPFEEVAEAVGKSPAAVRQIARRARSHVAGTDRSVIGTTAVWLDGAPALRIGSATAGAAVSLTVENGRITRIYATANPQKLTRLDTPVDLIR
ncbi:sigma-70 family RNA polymerase sigma factor [Kitasatospora sp. NBC_01250]|uniref:sigma-70 family RNA polymerase sigma factor n=1 Tax=Kitasatospora sp. NBC_01250 TaxID=2903571 RepID=UPI002E357262|nr:sigma-70 family RNA polymerase sigma factor [Kitasatospora sp. NBC_01250]